MNDIKQSHDPNSLAYYAPPGSQDAKGAAMTPRQDSGEAQQRESQQRLADEQPPHLRVVEGNEPRTRDTSDAFTAAVATALRQQIEAELRDASGLHQRTSLPGIATFGIAIAGAAAAALAYVVLFPPRQPTSEQHGPALTQLLTAAPRRPPPTLLVRNQSGTINEPLELGVSIERGEPGSTVTVKGMPIGMRITAGEQISPVEWRVPAENATDAVVIPPVDFTGEVKLLAELRSSDGAALVSAVVQLGWKAPPPPPAVPVAAVPAPQPAAAPPAPERAPPTPTASDLAANAVGSLIKRAQDMLAAGDVKGARALLLRAADAHDPRAAYALAQTYDPSILRPTGIADASDLAMSRSWYQRAREWGAPEAQHQLDALAATNGRGDK